MICSLPTSLITILASSIRTSTAGLPFADVACPNLGAERAVREDYTGGEILHARSGSRLARPRSADSGGTGGLSATVREFNGLSPSLTLRVSRQSAPTRRVGE